MSQPINSVYIMEKYPALLQKWRHDQEHQTSEDIINAIDNPNLIISIDDNGFIIFDRKFTIVFDFIGNNPDKMVYVTTPQFGDFYPFGLTDIDTLSKVMTMITDKVKL